MIQISGESVVTIYLNSMAFFMVLGLCIISTRVKSRKYLGDRIFLDMCIGVMVYAVFSTIEYLFIGPYFEKYYYIAFLSRTIAIGTMLVLSYQLLLYVDFMMYGSRDYLYRKYWKAAIPIVVCIALLVINIFTGIVFYESDEGWVYHDTPLYYLILLVMVVNFVASIVMAVKYNRDGGHMHFFHMTPMIIPYTVGMLLTIFSTFCAGPIGCAMGMTFIYFSLIERWRYDDAETGFYNKTYVDEVIKRSNSGKAEYSTALSFEVDRSTGVLIDVLKGLLPREGEVIRLSDNAFLLLLPGQGEKLAGWISSTVTRMTSEYDGSHPGEELGLQVRSYVRNTDKEETIDEFLQNVIKTVNA